MEQAGFSSATSGRFPFLVDQLHEQDAIGVMSVSRFGCQDEIIISADNLR